MMKRKSEKQLIDDKMRVLEDFDICDRHNEGMRNSLKQALLDNPNEEGRLVLDRYCRPIIQAKFNSWH